MTPLRIALAGAFALAVAMGIGRFAFTPILPMMLHDGIVDLAGASWLASANYVGYLLGALLCTFDPWLRRRLGVRGAAENAALVRRGLAATALLTAAMALPWPAAWAVLRFAAGIASAYVFVHSAGWCLGQLAARGAMSFGGVMYAGPGAGIVVTGLMAGTMVAWQWPASAAWVVFGVLAALLSAAVWGVFRGARDAPHPSPLPAGGEREERHPLPLAGEGRGEGPPHGTLEVAALALAYGLAGFGYIVTATYLPVIARTAIAGSPLIDLFWPIFGAGVFVGALLATRLHVAIDARQVLAAGYLMQAAGIGLGVAYPTEIGFAVGSVLLGLPFTVLTFFAMREARRIRPLAVASTIGLLTTLWAIGQALGPPVVAWLLQRGSGDAGAAFERGLVVAASTLLLGAAIYLASVRAWPAARPVA